MMKWSRFRGKGTGYSYCIASNKFIIQLTGGSIIIKDCHSNEIFKRDTGHHYLYTGDISPDETECFALENGKHFYVYSLEDFAQVKRVTLPKYYDSVDMFGHYSEDGKNIYIPAHRWIGDPHKSEGYYEYVVFRYEAENYTLMDKKVVDDLDKLSEYRWRLGDVWAAPAGGNPEPEIDSIMRIIFGDEYEV